MPSIRLPPFAIVSIICCFSHSPTFIRYRAANIFHCRAAAAVSRCQAKYVHMGRAALTTLQRAAPTAAAEVKGSARQDERTPPARGGVTMLPA